MSNALKIKNGESIITHCEVPQKASSTRKQCLLEQYHAVCEWFGIDGCMESQIYFFGVFLVPMFLLTIVYVIGGVCYGF
ncbi:hypothetical protein [Bacillus sp. Fil]|uniref:hypothetical protein n=1 Tax=Bacillus sp. Fil TaxID=3459567 RepID=UPI00403AE16B